MSGTLNDINVLQRSHFFARLASDDAPILLATTLSMGMNTQRGTILQMVYTLLGAHLSKASKNQKLKSNVNLQGCKRQPEKTLKEHSVFFNLGLTLSVVLLVFGIRKP